MNTACHKAGRVAAVRPRSYADLLNAWIAAASSSLMSKTLCSFVT